MSCAIQPLANWVKEYAEPIKIVFSLFAAIYVLIQYNESKYDERVKESLKYMEMFQNEDVATQKLYLDTFWINNFQFLDKKNETQTYEQQLEDIIKKQGDYNKHIYAVVF